MPETQGRARVACSGRARSVLDWISDVERDVPRQTVTLTLPLAPHAVALLQYQHPMRSGEWDQMMRLLEIMRPGVVSDLASARQVP